MSTTPATHDPMHRALAGVAAPLDAVRSRVLARVGRAGRTLLRDRSRRVSSHVIVGLVAAIVLSIAAPLWAFLLGPIVLGVPHLIADVRYLVVKPGLHRRPALVWTVGVPLALAAVTGSVSWGLAAGFGAIAFSRAAHVTRGLALLGWALVVAAAHRSPYVSTLVLVHGHNFLAIGLFCAAFARARRNGLMLAIGFVVLAAAVLAGAFDPLLGSSMPALRSLARTMAPVGDPSLAPRLVVVFVFAQGVHYMIWLRLVPDEARERPGLRTFASTFVALRRELGAPLLFGAACFALIVAGRAFGSLEGARVLYLRGASFHGFLEIAFALHMVLSRREGIVSA